MSQHEQIIEKCADLFIRFGVRNLTMDDIAKQLGMSKKTIYQHVSNKSDLVYKVLEDHLQKETLQYEAITKSTENALEENLRMVSFMCDVLKEFNTATIFDLQKYYPESYALLDEHREKVALRHILNNLKAGIKQGLYRDDMNPDIVARIYINALEILIDQQLFPSKKFHFFNLYGEFVRYHLRGILTPKGLKYLEQSKLLKSLEL